MSEIIYEEILKIISILNDTDFEVRKFGKEELENFVKQKVGTGNFPVLKKLAKSFMGNALHSVKPRSSKKSLILVPSTILELVPAEETEHIHELAQIFLASLKYNMEDDDLDTVISASDSAFTLAKNLPNEIIFSLFSEFFDMVLIVAL